MMHLCMSTLHPSHMKLQRRLGRPVFDWLLTLLLGILQTTSIGDSSICWTGGFTAEVCCVGRGGNSACWDAYFTYARCCGSASREAMVNAERLSLHEASTSCGEIHRDECKLARTERIDSSLIRGVAPKLQERYREAKRRGVFGCADGSHTIALSNINDDFCDCNDGSDEPGTSACSGEIAKPGLPGFHCFWFEKLDSDTIRAELQISATFVPVRFTVVNDGLCDCCNGEDEWDTDTLCTNTCDTTESPLPEVVSKARMGAHARLKYVERGRMLVNQYPYSNMPGGPDHAFLALAEKGCFEFINGKDIYNVCLFDKVTYKLGLVGREFILGRNGSWAESYWENGQARLDYTRLWMTDGEWCYRASNFRQVEVVFECAQNDSLILVNETSTCEYLVRFATPAACQPLRIEDAWKQSAATA